MKNTVRLALLKMGRDAIPDGGGLVDGIRFLSSKESMLAGLHAAQDFVRQAIYAVRNAAEPNPWRNADDEEIAGELLSRIEKRDQQRLVR